MVETEDPQDRGVEIVDVHPVVHGVESQFVGGADRDPPRNPATRHPHRESRGIVVAAVPLLAHRGAAELPTPDDERRVEQPALPQVGEQPGDRPIHLPAQLAMVLLDVGVGIPLAAGTVVELDEAHPALHQAPGQEAGAAERGGDVVVEPVEAQRGRRLGGEVDGLRRGGLHPVGELVVADPRLEVGLVGKGGRGARVGPGEEFELGLLPRGEEPPRRDEVGDRRCAPHTRALEHRRHEAGPPVARAVDHLPVGVLHDDERGQIGVFRAQAVHAPRPEARPAAEDGAGVHLAHAAGMVDAVGDTGADDRQFVDVLRDVGHPVADPRPRTAMPLPDAFVGQERRGRLPHRRDRRLEARRNPLPGQFAEQRFGVEQVEVARPPFHEQEDHTPRPGRMVGDPGGERIAAGLRLERRQRRHPEAAAGGPQPVATAERRRGTGRIAAARGVPRVIPHRGNRWS